MPSRSDFDPIDIPEVLPHLSLMEVVHGEPMRFRVRLMGTALVERYGEHTGQYMDEVGFGDAYEDVAYSYKACARMGQPQFSETEYWTDMRRYFRVSRLVLPLSEDDRTVNMVLAGLLFRTGTEDDRHHSL